MQPEVSSFSGSPRTLKTCSCSQFLDIFYVIVCKLVLHGGARIGTFSDKGLENSGLGQGSQVVDKYAKLHQETRQTCNVCMFVLVDLVDTLHSLIYRKHGLSYVCGWMDNYATSLWNQLLATIQDHCGVSYWQLHNITMESITGICASPWLFGLKKQK
jgi:hypothetical protein